MDNRSEYSYVNLPPIPPSAPETPASWRDIAAPLLALVLSSLYWACFALDTAFACYGPGIGVLVFVIAYFATVFVMLEPRRSIGGLALMAAAIVLALCCGLYAHIGLSILNCFVILLVSAMATFALSGQSTASAFSLRSIPEAIRLSFMALFTQIDRPFRLLRRFGQEKRGAALRVILSAVFSFVVLCVVLALLASADMVFGSFFADIRAWLEKQAPISLIWKLVRIVGLALLIASGLYFLRTEAPETRKKEKSDAERHTLPFLLPALLLDIVYILFCAVQLRYLFGGAEAAAMAGGWAEYARTGFFQLVAVAVINLALCVIGADARRFAAKGGFVLRIANGLMLVLTVVILLSAARRMQLYILAYGLSILRLITLWGMLVIAVGILAAAWKLARPGFAFFPVFFGFALGTWCLFCLLNPAGRVADHNVEAYLSGRLSAVDVDYLEELGPDTAYALRRLAEESAADARSAQTALLHMTAQAHDAQISWTLWKLSLRGLE